MTFHLPSENSPRRPSPTALSPSGALQRRTLLAPVLVLALGCGTMSRSVTFPQAAEVPPAPKAKATLALEQPRVNFESSMNSLWSNDVRQQTGAVVANDITKALGPDNVAGHEQADRLVTVDIQVKEVVDSSAGMTALRIIVPVAVGVAAAVLAYKGTADPCASHRAEGDFCVNDGTAAVRNSAVGFGLAWTLGYLGLSAIPSHDASYRTQATITVRDRLTGAIALNETVYAEHRDRFSNFMLPSKLDSAVGIALRKLEPGIAATLATRMPPLPAPTVPPPAAVPPTPPVAAPSSPAVPPPAPPSEPAR